MFLLSEALRDQNVEGLAQLQTLSSGAQPIPEGIFASEAHERDGQIGVIDYESSIEV